MWGFLLVFVVSSAGFISVCHRGVRHRQANRPACVIQQIIAYLCPLGKRFFCFFRRIRLCPGLFFSHFFRLRMQRKSGIILLSKGGYSARPIKEDEAMEKYECPCGYIYDPEVGDPEGGIAPGTKWEDIPEDWVCPVCGLGKDAFSPA